MPLFQKAQKTAEFPLVTPIDRSLDVPVVLPGQVPTIQTEQETVKFSQAQYLERIVDKKGEN